MGEKICRGANGKSFSGRRSLQANLPFDLTDRMAASYTTRKYGASQMNICFQAQASTRRMSDLGCISAVGAILSESHFLPRLTLQPVTFLHGKDFLNEARFGGSVTAAVI